MKFLLSDLKGQKVQSIAFLALFLFLFFSLLISFFFTSEFYLCIKSVHIISIISWMAGLLYMPRIFVYHSSTRPDTDQYKTFEIMEERLLKVIMNPAMVLSWVCGLYLAWKSYYTQVGWLRLKVIFVLILSFYHFYLAFLMKNSTIKNRLMIQYILKLSMKYPL
ncbi:CopD family protein [Candidatus Liberibacter africanus]|uniref:CopD family protein n=1 Tax=Liberibacter africanus TaxID=34020 RepID=UPI001FD5B18B|nr:CopD family protein [Candidatus Liberibacter africanus]